MIIEISVAVIAVAVIALVFFLIKTLQSLRQTLHQVNETLFSARKQLNDLGGEARQVIHHARELSADVHTKIESLNPLFQSVANVGSALERVTTPLNQGAAPVISVNEFEAEAGPTSQSDTVVEVIEWAALGLDLWQKFKKRR
jgi:uncharacterized protein YoxC